MRQMEGFRLRAIQKKDYNSILMWHRSTGTISGFTNPDFGFYDLASIQNMYSVERDDHLAFVIEGEDGFSLGMIIVRIEWCGRNGIVDIIMSAGRRMPTGAGFKALSTIIRYCKEELNLRRIEIKISEKNKVMQKAFKFFGTDAEQICDIFNGKGDWDDKIMRHFSLARGEYERNWEEYATRYVKEVIYASSRPKLILTDDAYMDGGYISCYNDAMLLDNIESSSLDHIIALAGGDFSKYEKYDAIQRFGSENKGKNDA